jgi:hypothetical protein
MNLFFMESPTIGIERKWVNCCLCRADITIRLILLPAAVTALLVFPEITENMNHTVRANVMELMEMSPYSVISNCLARKGISSIS